MHANRLRDAEDRANAERIAILAPDIGDDGSVRIARGRAIEGQHFQRIAIDIYHGSIRSGIGQRWLIIGECLVDRRQHRVGAAYALIVGNDQAQVVATMPERNNQTGACAEQHSAADGFLEPLIRCDEAIGIGGLCSIQEYEFESIAIIVVDGYIASGVGDRQLAWWRQWCPRWYRKRLDLDNIDEEESGAHVGLKFEYDVGSRRRKP